MPGGLLDFLTQNGGTGLLSGLFGQQGGQQGMPNVMSFNGAQARPDAQGVYGPDATMMPQGMPGQPQQRQPGINPEMFAAQATRQPELGGLLGALNNPLMHMGLGLASGNTAGEGIGNGLSALRTSLNQIADPEGKRQQQAVQNYIALRHLAMQEKSAEEKPQIQLVDDPNTGGKRIVQIQPFGRGAHYINPTEPGGGAAAPGRDPTIPAGADVKAVREARGKAAVANEEEAVKSAKAAADFAPHIDQAVSAYEAAMNANAIGPVAASAPMRANAKYNPVAQWMGSAPAEKARQNYDKAIASLQARVTAGQNSGQGAVSDYERKMYAAQFPDLQAMDPADQLKYLKQLQAQTKQTIAAGRIPSIGQAEQVGAVLDRPSIPKMDAAPPGAGGPAQITTRADYARLRPGDSYIAPDGSTRTKR